MDVEIPRDEITQLRSSLRKGFGFGSNDPDDELPSLSNRISELDTCQDCLWCKNCRGRILRGDKSLICVFCGEKLNENGVSRSSINFLDTIGCGWFLNCLHLDGSEMVQGPVEASQLSRGLNARKPVFPLSNLFNIELRCPSEMGECVTRGSDETLEQKWSTSELDEVVDNSAADDRVESVDDNSDAHGKVESVTASSAERVEPNEES